MIKLITFCLINICLFQLINYQMDSLFSQIKGQSIPLKGQLESLENDFKGLSDDLKGQLKLSQLTKISKLTGKLPIPDGVKKNLSADKLANVNALKDLPQAFKDSNLPTDQLNKIKGQLPGGLPKELSKKAAAPVLGDEDHEDNEDNDDQDDHDDQDDQAKSSTTTHAPSTSPKLTAQISLTQSPSLQTAHPVQLVQPQDDDEEQMTPQIIQTTSTEKIENSNNEGSDEDDDEESNENRADRPVRRKEPDKTVNRRKESVPVRRRQDKEMQRRNHNEDGDKITTATINGQEDDEDYYDDD